MWSWRTGDCGTTNPYINKVSIRSADAATKFRVFTTRSSSTATNTLFFGAASSMKLTADSVSCFNAPFQPGYTGALIAQGGELVVALYCDAPGGCSFDWNIDGGCTAAAVLATATGVQMDSCLSSCNPQGSTCASGTCTCSGGWSGTRCQIAPLVDPCASVSCGAHGTCGGNGVCTCRDGYTGATCSVAPSTVACPSGQTCNNGQCFTAGGITATTSCSCICSNGSFQSQSNVADCTACASRCASSSCNNGQSCSSSSSYQGPTATGLSCSTAPTPSSAASSTASAFIPGAGAAAYDPTVWLGVWSAQGCDTASCCCAFSTTITDSGGYYQVKATDLQGVCGTTTSVASSFPTPTSSTVSYTFSGQGHTATMAPSGASFDDTNSNAPQCSASLAKRGSTNSGATNGPHQLWMLAIVVGTALALSTPMASALAH